MKNKRIYEYSRFSGLTEISLQEAIEMSQLSDIEAIGEWLRKDINDIKFYYKLEPMEIFEDQAKEMESTYDEFIDEKERSEYILDLLSNGNKPYPIFVELENEDRFILEGRHRVVSFYWFKLKEIPVIYVK